MKRALLFLLILALAACAAPRDDHFNYGAGIVRCALVTKTC